MKLMKLERARYQVCIGIGRYHTIACLIPWDLSLGAGISSLKILALKFCFSTFQLIRRFRYRYSISLRIENNKNKNLSVGLRPLGFSKGFYPMFFKKSVQ
jgi:hypothetical protein